MSAVVIYQLLDAVDFSILYATMASRSSDLSVMS